MLKIIIVTLLILLLKCNKIQIVDVNMQLPQLISSYQYGSPMIYQLNVLQTMVYQLDRVDVTPIPIFNKDCRYNTGSIQIKQKVRFNGSFPTISEHFIYSQKYGVIYRINNQQLVAYKYSNNKKTLTKFDSLKFENKQCTKSAILTNDQQYLYIFDCYKITRISVLKILGDIQIIMNLQHAYSGQKVIIANQLLIWINSFQRPRVFGITPDYNLTQILNIPQLQDIVDGAYLNNKLFLLSRFQYIYILQQTANNSKQLIIKSIVSLYKISSQASNLRIKLWKNNIYVFFQQRGEEFIVQLQYMNKKDEVIFIRVFKNFQNLVNFDIVQNLLLMVTNHNLNILEINQDPRTIIRVFNGVSNNHFDEVIGFQRLNNLLFVSVTAQQINLLELKIIKAHISCVFQQAGVHNLKFIQKCKPLKIQQQSQQIKFNTKCQANRQFIFNVHDPNSKYHIYAVILIFLFCIAVISFMIAWRNDKIFKIQLLLHEINRLGGKSKHEIQFVEEHNTRQIQWNDIKQDYGMEKHREQQERQKQQQNRKRQQQEIEEEDQQQQQADEQDQQQNNVATERQMIQR